MSKKTRPAIKKSVTVRAVLGTYARYAAKYPGLLTVFIVTSVLLQVAELTSPLFLRKLYNILAVHHPTPEVMASAVNLFFILASITFSGWVIRRVMSWSNVYLDGQVMRDIHSETFTYVIGHSYGFFTSHFAGSLTHKINKFSRAFETIADDAVMTYLPTLLYTSGSVIILYTQNRALGLLLLLWFVAIVTFQLWMTGKRHEIRKERSDIETAQTGAVSDTISNHLTVQLFGGHQFEKNRNADISNRWLAATLRDWKFDYNVWGGLGLMMILANITLLYVAIGYWKLGLLTIGDFILMQTYLIGAANNLLGVNRQLRRFYDAVADAGEMVHIINTPHEVQDARDAKALSVKSGNITLQNVEFYFHEGKPILEHLSCDIHGGQKIALVGPSGAGKSTITKLLLRLFDVKSGSIEIDGQNIARVTQESLRNAISFVPQEPVLFHRTLMENIRYGRRDATDEEVIEAAKKAHCHEFISNLPEAYDTYVGERGIKLSGGERQRVAIARAILKNSPILILDEATSSLDSESESLIQDALETLMQGKTVIVIAHRLSTIMKMDRIIVLENGTIVADGTHDELLSQDGLYQKLWSIQAGGFITDEDETDTLETQGGALAGESEDE